MRLAALQLCQREHSLMEFLPHKLTTHLQLRNKHVLKKSHTADFIPQCEADQQNTSSTLE